MTSSSRGRALRWPASCLVLVTALIVTLSPRALRAEAGEELTVSVLTFGPGDHPFSKFGHDGILVEDEIRGSKLVYNYGTYAFDSYALIPKFLLGKYRYWLSVTQLASTLATYAAENRSVTVQRLALTPSEKRELVEFLKWNARGENKYYEYDYYRDNCATRIRDVVDRASGGALQFAKTTPAALTFREHTLRLTADDFAVFLGLHGAMGPLIDRRVPLWDEMFLPGKLEETLDRALIASPGLPPRRLVEAKELLVASDRPLPRNAPPRWTLGFLAAGVVVGAALASLGYQAKRGHAMAARVLGAFAVIFGAGAGLFGSLLLALATFTNHEVAYRNENILQSAPVALGLVVPGIATLLGREGLPSRLRHAALLGFALSAAGLAFKILPWFPQDNRYFIALFLPIWAGLALATLLTPGDSTHRLHREGPASGETSGVERGDEIAR